MQDVIAPTMGERASGVRTCVDDHPHPCPVVLSVITVVLHMTASVPVLVLLFVAQSGVTVWNGCARGARFAGHMMTPAGLNAFTSLCSWRRALYVFYLGAVAGWTSSQNSWSCASQRSVLQSEIRAPSSSDSELASLELLEDREITLAPEGRFVLGGHRAAAVPGERAVGIEHAA